MQAEQAVLTTSLRLEFKQMRERNSKKYSDQRLYRQYIRSRQGIKERSQRIEDVYAEQIIKAGRISYASIRRESIQSRLYMKCLLQLIASYETN